MVPVLTADRGPLRSNDEQTRSGPGAIDSYGAAVEIVGAAVPDAVLRARRWAPLEAGAIFVGDVMVSEVLAWDERDVVLQVDVPARGRLVRPPG